MKWTNILATLLTGTTVLLLGGCSDGTDGSVGVTHFELTQGMEFYVGNLHAHTR